MPYPRLLSPTIPALGCVASLPRVSCIVVVLLRDNGGIGRPPQSLDDRSSTACGSRYNQSGVTESRGKCTDLFETYRTCYFWWRDAKTKTWNTPPLVVKARRMLLQGSSIRNKLFRRQDYPVPWSLVVFPATSWPSIAPFVAQCFYFFLLTTQRRTPIHQFPLATTPDA